MGTARAEAVFPGTVHEAELCWYDVSRWPSWVDGVAEISNVEGDWPQSGSSVTWESGPAGRGRVLERVAEYEPRSGQGLEVEDETLTGFQRVSFTPAGDHVQVRLSLDYRIRKRSLLTPLLDVFFIRRVVTSSLNTTLMRFASELAASRAGC